MRFGILRGVVSIRGTLQKRGDSRWWCVALAECVGVNRLARVLLWCVTFEVRGGAGG